MGTEKLLRNDTNPKIPRIDALGRTFLQHKIETSGEGASYIEPWQRARLIAFIRKGATFYQASILARRIMKKSLIIEDYQYLKGYADRQAMIEERVQLMYPRQAENKVTKQPYLAWVNVSLKETAVFKHLWDVYPVLPDMIERVVISRKYWDGLGNEHNLLQELRDCGKVHVSKMIENMLDQFRAEIRKSKNNNTEKFPVRRPK